MKKVLFLALLVCAAVPCAGAVGSLSGSVSPASASSSPAVVAVNDSSEVRAVIWAGSTDSGETFAAFIDGEAEAQIRCVDPQGGRVEPAERRRRGGLVVFTCEFDSEGYSSIRPSAWWGVVEAGTSADSAGVRR